MYQHSVLLGESGERQGAFGGAPRGLLATARPDEDGGSEWVAFGAAEAAKYETERMMNE